MKNLFIAFLALFIQLSLGAQVSISDDPLHSPDSSAILDLKSTDKGLLIPRLTLSERNSMTEPANGLMIYQTDDAEGFYFNKGSSSTPEWTLVNDASNTVWQQDAQSVFLSDANDSVGIGTSNPTAKLSTDGMIEAMQDGFKFPDGSVQSTAVYPQNYRSYETGADGRWVIAMCADNINGSWDEPAFPDCSKVIDLDWGVYYPVDPGGGGITGSRIHRELSVIKNIDRASIMYIQKLIEGQVILFIDFKFIWYNTQNQSKEVYYKIRLENVRVLSFDHDVSHVGNDFYSHVDIISFLFESIEWEWFPDGIYYDDDLSIH